jgi:cytochrome P450
MKGELLKDPNQLLIFHEVLESDIPPQEKSVVRLGEEAQTVLAAGLETTAWALTTGSFYIINNPEVFKRLRAELKEALPDPKGSLDWLQLEKLPYLSACI